MNCSICNAEILPGKQPYVLRIDLFAAPEELEISKEELEKDRRGEFEKIMEQLEAMDAEAMQEETERRLVQLATLLETSRIVAASLESASVIRPRITAVRTALSTS